MRHYSDPTAARGLSGINREFSRLERIAKKIHHRVVAGTITPEELEQARGQFRGIYRHVLDIELAKPLE